MSGECQSSVSIGEYRVPSQERGWMLWDNVSQTEVGEGRGERGEMQVPVFVDCLRED